MRRNRKAVTWHRSCSFSIKQDRFGLATQQDKSSLQGERTAGSGSGTRTRRTCHISSSLCHLEAPALWNCSALAVDTGTSPITFCGAWKSGVTWLPTRWLTQLAGSVKSGFNYSEGEVFVARTCEPHVSSLDAIRCQPNCSLHPRVNFWRTPGTPCAVLILPCQRPQRVQFSVGKQRCAFLAATGSAPPPSTRWKGGDRSPNLQFPTPRATRLVLSRNTRPCEKENAMR